MHRCAEGMDIRVYRHVCEHVYRHVCRCVHRHKMSRGMSIPMSFHMDYMLGYCLRLLVTRPYLPKPTYAHAYTSTHVCAHVRAHMSMSMSMCVSIDMCIGMPMHTSMYLSTHTHASLHVSMHTYMHVSMHMPMHMSMHVLVAHVYGTRLWHMFTAVFRVAYMVCPRQYYMWPAWYVYGSISRGLHVCMAASLSRRRRGRGKKRNIRLE